MKKIYEQHDKHFSHVAAYVFIKDNQQLNVSFKFPKDGAGRLYCYIHLIGSEMARGFADGYGYDKKSAAFCDAVRNLPEYEPYNNDVYFINIAKEYNEKINYLKQVFNDIGGRDWPDILKKEGWHQYNVL